MQNSALDIYSKVYRLLVDVAGSCLCRLPKPDMMKTEKSRGYTEHARAIIILKKNT